MSRGLEGVVGRPVPREALDRLDGYAGLLREENERQNLVSGASLENLWDRHILDSAQLLRFEPGQCSTWADIGSGAGLPGLVIAALTEGHVTLIEPRRLRAEFLQRAADALGLSERVTVLCAKVERIAAKFDVITARAVAPLARLLDISHHLSTTNTRWVLPKGRRAESELAEALRTWQGEFHVEQSVTDADSWIIVGTGVGAKRR